MVPQRLQRAVEEYWLAKGRDVSVGGGYFLEAVGWEAPTGMRIVFKALRRVTRLLATAGVPATDDSPERFLGFWSTEMTGSTRISWPRSQMAWSSRSLAASCRLRRCRPMRANLSGMHGGWAGDGFL